MLVHAKKIAQAGDYIQGDILNLPFINKPIFHGIWCSGILLHVPHKLITPILKNLFDLLNKDGIIYISVKEGIGEKFEPDYRYGYCKKFWSFHKENSLLKKMKKVGFLILDSYVTNSLFGPHLDPTKWIIIFGKK